MYRKAVVSSRAEQTKTERFPRWGYSLEHKQVVSGILRVQRNGISCLILSNSRIEILIGFAAWSHAGLNDGLNNNQFYVETNENSFQFRG